MESINTKRFEHIKIFDQELKYDRTNMATIVFKAENENDNINYSYFHFSILNFEEDLEKNSNNFFFTTGPGLESQDGEFRQGFVTFTSQLKFEKDCPNIFILIKDYFK